MVPLTSARGLRELGYVEGQTIAIEYRSAEGQEERFPDLASELVHLKVDVIFAAIAAAVRAARHATKAIPIVTVVNDPVAAGFVVSLAGPGGNITGLSMMSPAVVGKQLELLREVVPQISRVAVLANPANPGNAPQLRQAEVVARALGMRLQPLERSLTSEPSPPYQNFRKGRDDRTKPDPDNHPVAIAAFDGLGTCQQAMVNEQRGQLAGKEPGRRWTLCFPDTVDPRGPKGK